MDARDRTADLLAERPELEGSLRDILAVDEREAAWSFEDVPVDSGTFGEVVSRGIVVEDGEGYRVADPEAVRAVVEGEEGTDDDGGGVAVRASLPSVSVDRRVATALAAVLGLVALVRVLPYPLVYRGEGVVLPSNDPYYYRYWVEELLARSGGALDPSVLSDLPGAVANGEPLTVAVLWAAASLAGGGSAVAGHVLAWAPVVAALATAVFVYLLAVRLTADRRVGVAAVGLLAVIPPHAMRTGLGFVDHHAFDYVWLAATALCATALLDADARDPARRARRTWAVAGALGVAVAGQALAWEASPLLLGPLGIAAALVAVSSVRAEESPVRSLVPLFGGLGLAGVLAGLAHVALGWHGVAVVAAPFLVLAYGVGVAMAVAVARRLELGVRGAFGAVVAWTVAVGALPWLLSPDLVGPLARGLDVLATTEGIAETTSLLSGRLGSIAAPLIVTGFGLFLALPYLCWASWRCYRRHSPAWLVAVAYAWYFLALSVVQLRFAGELSAFVAVFGGLGFVHVAAWVDLARPPSALRDDDGGPAEDDPFLPWPGRRDAMYTGALALGAGSLGAVLSTTRHLIVAIDDGLYEAAVAAREYAAARGLSYPRTYVFSDWSENRALNYLVNGRSRSYVYARRNYDAFATATDGEAWYRRLRERAGFVVVSEVDDDLDDDALYTRLFEEYGSHTGHYRVIHAAGDGGARAFALVPGATLAGRLPEDDRPGGSGGDGAATATVSVAANAGDERFTYEREAPVSPGGWFAATVAHPGEYDAGGRTRRVDGTAVESGSLVLSPAGDRARWSFDEGRGDVAFDVLGGYHGRLVGATRTDAGDGGAVTVGGEAYVEFPEVPTPTDERSLSVRFRTAASDDGSEESDRVLVSDEGASGDSARGFRIALAEGRVVATVGQGDPVWGPAVDDGDWHRVVLTRDGEAVTLFVDGERVGRAGTANGPLVAGPVHVGGTPGSDDGLRGDVDAVRVENRVLDPAAARSSRRW